MVYTTPDTSSLRIIVLITAGLLMLAGISQTTTAATTTHKWNVHPRIRLSLCYDETAIPRTGRDRTPVDTLCTRFSPGISLSRKDGVNLLDMRYDFETRTYEELSNRDTQTHRTYLRWRQKLNENLTVDLNDRLTYSLDSGGEEDEAISRPSTYTHNRFDFGLRTRGGERWSWLFDLAQERRLYDDRYFDNWYTVAPAVGIECKTGKNCRLSLRQELKYLSVEDTGMERTRQTLLGYACRLPWSLSFDVRGGVLTLDDGTTTEPAGSIRLSRRWEKAAVSVRWQRNTTVSSGTARVVRRDYLVVQPRYTFDAKTSASARIGLVEQKSIDNDYTDTTTWRSGVNVRRRLTETLSADLGYTYVDQDVRGRSGTPLAGSIIALGLSATF